MIFHKQQKEKGREFRIPDSGFPIRHSPLPQTLEKLGGQ